MHRMYLDQMFACAPRTKFMHTYIHSHMHHIHARIHTCAHTYLHAVARLHTFLGRYGTWTT